MYLQKQTAQFNVDCLALGIVAQETPSGYEDSMVPSSYVYWLMMGGSRVMAINLLIPGGSLSVTTSKFSTVSRLMLDKAMKANSEGDYFPVWGICLGFQILVNYVAGRNRLFVTPGMDDVSLPLSYTRAASTSRLLGNSSQDVYDSLKTDSVTYHTHNYGVHLWKFQTQPELVQFFSVIATNVDANNKSFASMIEAKDPRYPMYGSQWHPEKNSFDWDPTKAVNHSASGIRATQYLANFFIGEARKNKHQFVDVGQEGPSLIQTERRRYFTGGKFQENFYIDFKE
ncbi:gamma-glutamyl hydrolase [Plakobranchus ocellatus]|uniref:folate gamma-glutamyl hydrolase n=1 Tax=Plakobranchus ocellatus TaxID=259542 RepID=A0AAV4D228_9GAST|nr:gamma-glutamyl hydrolase [Plakobranchus ocellatus]